jgi:putative membrane protein
MTDARRLHRAAIVIYAADALRNAAFPLIAIFFVSVLGGGLDTGALLRALAYGAAGITFSLLAGFLRWRTTWYVIGADAVHHHSGVLSKKVTDVPLARIEALDVNEGPLQRAFGVVAVDIQTGAAGKGGEIALPALTPAAVEELRAARPTAVAAPEVVEPPSRRLALRELAIAAVTAGQLAILLPVLAGAAQIAQQLLEEDRGEGAARLLPQSGTGLIAVAAVLVLAAWLLSILGAVVAFAGFTLTREGDRLRISRGIVQRREATVPVARVRAVRVVEGILRRPLGFAALTVEVTGYAEEEAAARTLFPLVRVRDVSAFLAELLPELADDVLPLERPPRRAIRRYVYDMLVAGALVAVPAWFVIGPFSLVFPLAGALYGFERWRSAGWRLRDGRLAMRSLRFARVTVLAPARFRESQTCSQSVWQRRIRLADLEVAYGKSTIARIRDVEAAEAWRVWAAL